MGQPDPPEVGAPGRLRLTGAGHLSYTDLQVQLPQIADAGRVPAAAVQTQVGTIDPAASVAAQRAYVDAFLDLALRHRDTHLLDGSSSSVSFQVGMGTNSAVDQISVTLSAALSTTLSLNSLDIGSGGVTTTAITNIDSAINTVSTLRGTLGAVQNRLGSTINNLAIQAENLSAAESRIRDVDVAYETAQLTRNQILQNASIAVLAQANALPQSALRLLGA